MNDNTCPATDTVRLRLTLNVTYRLNGESSAEMAAHLRRMCEHAIGNGLLTGETAAEVDAHSLDVCIPPSLLLETEIVLFLRQRIEDGHLLAEDIPARLVRYGLTAPEALVAEMRERMALAAD